MTLLTDRGCRCCLSQTPGRRVLLRALKLKWMAKQEAADQARTQRRQHCNQLLQALLQSVQINTQLFAGKRCHKLCLHDSGCLTEVWLQAALTS